MKNSTRSGFSLVETALAIGIVSFALVGLLVLLGSSVKQSGNLISQHQIASALEATKHYFRATDGYAVAANLPDAAATPKFFTILSDPESATGAFHVNPDPAASGSGHRFLVGLCQSPTPVAANEARVLIRVRLYSLPAGSTPFPGSIPQYEGDLAIRR